MAEEQVVPSPDVHFEPIIKLPLVEIKTLEEDEEILFEMRAKLFRFDTSGEENPEWKERGTGTIKILKHRDDDSVRILMRRDKTLKICANHYILPYMELKPNNTSDRAWLWTTVADFADEEQKSELFAIKFGDAEKAQKFKAAFEEAVKIAFKKQEEAGKNKASAPDSSSDNESEGDGAAKDPEGGVSKDNGETKNSSAGEQESEVVAKLQDLSLKKDVDETESNDSSKT